MEVIKKQHNLEEDNGLVKTQVEETLQAMNIKRQAYHSNSFIGNHCHKLLTVRIFIIVLLVSHHDYTIFFMRNL